ncbi:MAG: hypothetical protein WCC53_10535 [Thermoanaerobaculia bacterium]
MPLPTEFSVTLTRRDIALARLYVYFRSGWGIGIALLGIFLSASAYIGYARGYESGLRQVFMPAFITLVAIPLGVVLGGINSPQVKKLLSGPIAYRVLPEHFSVSTAWAHADTPWPELRHAYRMGSIYLLSAPGALHIIPSRCLSSGQRVALHEALTDALGRRAHLGSQKAA